MDPEEALRTLLDALSKRDPDRTVVQNSLDDLLGWVDRGGFLPKVKRLPVQWEDEHGASHPAFAIGV
jgi:hypothetical protein